MAVESSKSFMGHFLNHVTVVSVNVNVAGFGVSCKHGKILPSENKALLEKILI